MKSEGLCDRLIGHGSKRSVQDFRRHTEFWLFFWVNRETGWRWEGGKFRFWHKESEVIKTNTSEIHQSD